MTHSPGDALRSVFALLAAAAATIRVVVPVTAAAPATRVTATVPTTAALRDITTGTEAARLTLGRPPPAPPTVHYATGGAPAARLPAAGPPDAASAPRGGGESQGDAGNDRTVWVSMGEPKRGMERAHRLPPALSGQRGTVAGERQPARELHALPARVPRYRDGAGQTDRRGLRHQEWPGGHRRRIESDCEPCLRAGGEPDAHHQGDPGRHAWD